MFSLPQTDTIEEGYEVSAPLRVTPCNAACYETRAFYEQLLEINGVLELDCISSPDRVGTLFTRSHRPSLPRISS